MFDHGLATRLFKVIDPCEPMHTMVTKCSEIEHNIKLFYVSTQQLFKDDCFSICTRPNSVFANFDVQQPELYVTIGYVLIVV